MRAPAPTSARNDPPPSTSARPPTANRLACTVTAAAFDTLAVSFARSSGAPGPGRGFFERPAKAPSDAGTPAESFADAGTGSAAVGEKATGGDSLIPALT